MVLRGFSRGAVPIILAVIVVLSFYNARVSRESACTQIQQLKVGFVQQLHRAKVQLPQYSYYRNADASEKALILAEIDRQIILYKPKSC